MGLFDTLGVNMSEIQASGFTNPPDDYYEFEIAESTIRNGTKKEPNATKFVVEYSLGEAGTTSEWWTVAEDGEVTEKARKSLGFLKSRLADLGVDADTFDPEEDDLAGITGSLQLVTRNGFQNVRNVTVEETEAEDEPEPEEEPDTAAEDAARKKRVAANKAARETTEAPAKDPAKKAPAKRPAAKSVDEENPFE